MASSSKKARLDDFFGSDNKGKDKGNTGNLIAEVQKARISAGVSSLEFRMNKKRVRIISACETVPDDSQGIVYWVSRDCRVQDNWAALYAQKIALKNELPLHFCFCLLPKFLDATHRHFDFLLKGIKFLYNDYKY